LSEQSGYALNLPGFAGGVFIRHVGHLPGLLNKLTKLS
jgi:hypothetical protein